MKRNLISLRKVQYNSKVFEAIVFLADYVYNNSPVKKSYISDIVNIQFGKFDDAYNFLKSLSLVKESMLPKIGDNDSKYESKPQLWIKWKVTETPELVRDIQRIKEYFEIDLSNYLIRDFDKLDEEDKSLLQKFVWKINIRSVDFTKKFYNKISSKLNPKIPAKLSTLYKSVGVGYRQMFGVIKDMLERKEVELGIKDNTVVFYRNPNYQKKKPFWFCNCCNARNTIRNKYCGQCGEKK